MVVIVQSSRVAMAKKQEKQKFKKMIEESKQKEDVKMWRC